MNRYIWIDGRCVGDQECTYSLKNCGLEHGAGVFTTMRLHNGHIECLQAHIDRLLRHARQHGLQLPVITPDYFYELVEKNQAYEGTFRLKALIVPTALQTTAGSTPWGKSSLMLYIDPYTPSVKEAVRLNSCILEPSWLIAKIKTLSRLERRMLFFEASQKGVDEYLTTTKEGIVLEALYANVFWHHQGVFSIPDRSLPYMFGITLTHILTAVQRLGMNVQEVKLRLEEIPQEANLFISNALIWCRPVEAVDGRLFRRDLLLEQALLQELERLIK